MEGDSEIEIGMNRRMPPALCGILCDENGNPANHDQRANRVFNKLPVINTRLSFDPHLQHR